MFMPPRCAGVRTERVKEAVPQIDPVKPMVVLGRWAVSYERGTPVEVFLESQSDSPQPWPAGTPPAPRKALWGLFQVRFWSHQFRIHSPHHSASSLLLLYDSRA
jgi:hypothetical protein